MIAALIAAAGLMSGLIPQPAGTPQGTRSDPATPPTAAAPPSTPTSSPSTAPAPKDGAAVVAQLVTEADTLTPLMDSPLARSVLEQARHLPVVETRTVYRKPGTALSAAAWERLSDQDKSAYKPRPCTPEFYFYTGYGSPLVYARVVDVMARHGVSSLAGARVMDFGYGTIGHLRLMSRCGAQAHGVEIEPLFEALYGQDPDVAVATDLGTGSDAPPSIVLHTGQWPADNELAKRVSAGGRNADAAQGAGGFDVITSKNTLKKGYVHPEPPPGKTVDERQLVKLGVDDGAFLAAVRDALKPGGLFIIYNISPAQSPADDPTKPYLPMADGRSPFTRQQYEAAGFEVLEFDTDDQAWVLRCWKALGYDQGKPRNQAATEVFAHVTVVRKKA